MKNVRALFGKDTRRYRSRKDVRHVEDTNARKGASRLLEWHGRAFSDLFNLDRDFTSQMSSLRTLEPLLRGARDNAHELVCSESVLEVLGVPSGDCLGDCTGIWDALQEVHQPRMMILVHCVAQQINDLIVSGPKEYLVVPSGRR